jgi:hypothetical protein
MVKISKPLFLTFFLILITVATIGGFFFFSKRNSSPAGLSSLNEKTMFWPPQTIKAVYLTAWSAASPKMFDYVVGIAKDTEINAVVIDIKDWSGLVSYDTQVPEAREYGAERKLIPDLKSFLEKFYRQGIYTIARIVVFQDPVLAASRPDLAVHRKSASSSVWLDKSGLAWIDPAAREAWDYNVALAEDALSQGFDEVNFDYVRFPSDGDTQDMSFPVWDGNTKKSVVIGNFFRYLREKMPKARLSVDLFGLATVSREDLGVGQMIEDAFESFDFVCPMVYPSHYALGFHGFENPAEHAPEVVGFSLQTALNRLKDYSASHPTNARLRPWLQDFNMGGTYDKETVRSEINAAIQALGNDYYGFMLWNSENFYTRDALSSR